LWTLYNSIDWHLLVNDHDDILLFRKKNAEQRQNVITELVLTEKEYVRDLKITYEIFNLHNPRPLEDRGIDTKVVFGNILEVSKKCLIFGPTCAPLPFASCKKLALTSLTSGGRSAGIALAPIHGTACLT
jgi:hypothetical protein